MNIDIVLEDIDIDLRVTVNAPNKWGKEIMENDKVVGETTRDYFALEEHIVEMVEQGNIEVDGVNDLSVWEEKENITITIDDPDL